MLLCRKAYAEKRYAEKRYAECRYAECRYAECRYSECRGAVPTYFYFFEIPTDNEEVKFVIARNTS